MNKPVGASPSGLFFSEATFLAPHSVVIVGGGLAGLTAAYRFHQIGIDFQLLEARTRLGGRILSAEPGRDGSNDTFDLGPSWFWPVMHSAISPLVEELGLPFFAQYADGDMIFEREASLRRFPAMRQEPQSMRFAGGVGALVSALATDLPAACIHLGLRVTHITLGDEGVAVGFVDANRVARSFRRHPTREPHETGGRLRPGGHRTRNLFAVYDEPFWRGAGFS